ncbi:MAG: ATP-binding cassette domain-containing protein [Bryobacteraceae bacterium]
MAYLSFRNVSFEVAGRTILDRLSLDVDRGQTLVLLGRSGSGKTTALRLVNRLLDPSRGEVIVDGKEISRIDPIPLRRRVGYVIQEFGLMPHWTVEENVTLTLRLLDRPVPERASRAKELLDQVGLPYDQFRLRRPHELSGGQRQRVSVARALAANPPLLLFDEPFGALDPVTRHEMQEQFLQLRSKYNFASVFVTHDLLEALTLGTQIAVLNAGRLEIVTTPSAFFSVRTPTALSFLNTLPPQLLEERGKWQT